VYLASGEAPVAYAACAYTCAYMHQASMASCVACLPPYRDPAPVEERGLAVVVRVAPAPPHALPHALQLRRVAGGHHLSRRRIKHWGEGGSACVLQRCVCGRGGQGARRQYTRQDRGRRRTRRAYAAAAPHAPLPPTHTWMPRVRTSEAPATS
jgi:hypothetical protein